MSTFGLNWEDIQEYYTKRENEIRGSLALDKVETDNILPIKVDGVYFPMQSSYVFDLKKVYTSEPVRTLSGEIPVFPAKIFVPYFTINYRLLTLDNYYEMMKKLQSDENVVVYYDSFDKKYKTAKFYVQQPSLSDFIAIDGKYQYVKDLQLVFAGTLNP
jgi:hypothetical protein